MNWKIRIANREMVRYFHDITSNGDRVFGGKRRRRSNYEYSVEGDVVRLCAGNEGLKVCGG